jgi:hypothetical protein
VAADGVDSVDNVLALVAGLAQVDEGVHLSKRVVVASQVEALGVVGLDGWVVAGVVGQRELGVHDGVGVLGVVCDGGHDLSGDVGQDATVGEEGVELLDGLQLGGAGLGLFDLLGEDGSWYLHDKLLLIIIFFLTL